MIPTCAMNRLTTVVLVALLALALPALWFVAFLLSPWMQNAFIVLYHVNFPPPMLVEMKTPMVAQWFGLVPALDCARTVQAQSLAGWWLQPASRCITDTDSDMDGCGSATPLSRTILYLHGNAENRAYPVTHARYTFFTAHPLCADVFAFDYRGFGENDGVPTQAGLIEDVIAMIGSIASNHSHAIKHFSVYGHSLGSSLATLSLATMLTNESLSSSMRVNALMLEGAFTSVIDTAVTYLPPPLSHSHWVRELMLAKLETQLDSITALQTIQFTVPTLLIHGTKDSTIEYWNAERMWAILRSDNGVRTRTTSEGNVTCSGAHSFVTVVGAEHHDTIKYNITKQAIIDLLTITTANTG